MKKLNILWLLALLFFQACSHIGFQQKSVFSPEKELSPPQKNQLYEHIANEIKVTNAIHLKECNCMKAFYRNLLSAPDNTARYVFDNKVGQHAVMQSFDKDSVSVLAIGSGTLLNELTAFANILARGKNLKIYLTDWAYVFYGEHDFKEKALKFGNNPETLPDGWKDFYFWAWAKNNEQPFLPFFEKHHQAIDEFKAVIKRLDQIYNTRTTVEIIRPATSEALNLPPLDMIISIDAFIDLPNLMWNLFYQMKLSNNPVRFIALSKTKPLGGFWDSPDLTLREAYSMKPVSIDIYDVTSKEGFGSYKLVEHTIFQANAEQIKKAPEFVIDPKKDSTQSPLEDGK